VVPLSNQALQILEDLKPLTDQRDYIFPSGIQPRQPANSSTVNMALRRMGYKGKLVSHGLRSIASTVLHEQQFNSDLIETALAHVDKNTTRAAYNRAEYLEQRRVMMQWWSNYIEEAATGKSPFRGKKHLKIA